MSVKISILLVLLSLKVVGQSVLTVADNTLMSNLDSSFIVVKGGVKIKNNGFFKNKGSISLTDNWVNNSGSEAFFQNNGGNVILKGLAQDIEGSSETFFNNLKMEGGVKSSIQRVSIKNELELNDCEFKINNDVVTLLNPSPVSLVWENSFISSQDLGGYFVRSVNSNELYKFPVGSNDLTKNHRVVEILPQSADLSSFGVRLSSVSPSDEFGVSASLSSAPFPIEQKANGVRIVNEVFYHNIYRFSGVAEAKAKIYFYNEDNDDETVFRSVAKWNSPESEWQDDDFVITAVDSIITAYNTPTLVAESKKNITYEDDVYSLTGINLIFPNSFTPNGDGFNDVFEVGYLMDEYPNNSIVIYNRWGEQVFKASPYLNDWDGISRGKGLKLLGDKLLEDTYFYVLKLDDNVPPVKKYVELILD